MMPQFTAGELRVMELLWKHGELKPAELQRLHPTPIKNPALRSYLAILLAKGHVVRRKVGKAYFYQAKTTRRRAFSAMLRELLSTFCGGSIEQLVMTLVRSENLSEEDLVEIKRLADSQPETPDTPATANEPSKKTIAKPSPNKRSKK